MTNLQYIKKPSKRRQAEDAILAGNAFKDNKCGKYDPKINPYWKIEGDSDNYEMVMVGDLITSGNRLYILDNFFGR